MDLQGGKQFAAVKKQQELTLDEVNKLYLDDESYVEQFPDLSLQLETFKKQFMTYDMSNSGDIDEFELKLMLEKLGQARTHMEIKKMILEVDRENRGAISYNDFLFMMLGKKHSVLKLILKFEKAMKGADKPEGVAPKRSLSSLP